MHAALRLTPIDGPAASPFELAPADGAAATAGRAAECELCLPHEGVSRSHARIAWTGDAWTITDLHSTGGTELAAEAPGGESADPDNPILANYGFNTLKVRLRAHPDVAERHHADLLAGTQASR